MFRKNLLIIPIFIIGYFAYQFFFIGDDEKQIKSLFNEIETIVKIDGTLKKQQILGRTLQLKKLIAKDVTLKAFEDDNILFETESFDSIQGAAFMGAKYLSEHSAILQETSYDIKGSKAQIDVVIVSNGKTIESDSFRELFSATFKLEKKDDIWIIISARGERMTSDYE